MQHHTNNAIKIFHAAVAAVQPRQLLPHHLSLTSDVLTICGQTISRTHIRHLKLIAIGKAASAMAQEAESILGNAITHGLCITKHDHALPLRHCQTIEAGHPTPDDYSLQAGNAVRLLVADAHPDDVVILLLSGGASALLCDLPSDCTLQDLQRTTQLLVNSGAGIAQINTVRKHLSHLKGGGLARAAHPARLFTLVLSDVVGDELDAIASGPTVPDSTTFADAWNVVQQFNLAGQLPPNIRTHLQKGVQGQLPETPKAGDAAFEQTHTSIIGSNRMALQAAAAEAKRLGYAVQIIQENITANTVAVAQELVQAAVTYNGPLPACLLAGGETTLQVSGSGKGGRNQHFVLAALQALQTNPSPHHITVLSAGTDGTDGPTDAAGAVVSNTEMINSVELADCLSRFDAYHYFERHGGLIKTGPTQTNVMDVMVVLVG